MVELSYGQQPPFITSDTTYFFPAYKRLEGRTRAGRWFLTKDWQKKFYARRQILRELDSRFDKNYAFDILTETSGALGVIADETRDGG